MKKLVDLIRASALELKNVASLTVTAMLTALYVVLHTFTTIVITPFLQLRFSPVALAMTGALYGPVVGGIAGAVGDILKTLIRPTGGFFPGFTVGEFLRGFIYGLFLYKKQPTFLRVLFATITSCVVVDFFLTTMWLAMMGVGAFVPLLMSRVLKVIILIPIETFLVFGAVKLTKKVMIRTIV